MAVNSLGVCVNEKLITALLTILLALGGWNLSQTFKLSNEMTEVKVKVEQVEKAIGKSFKKNKRKNKRKQKVE
jgi:hypothetical protein